VSVRYIDTPNRVVKVGGVAFAYREVGLSSGIPLILLNHFTGVLDDWDPRVVDGLSAEHRVITFDNKGVGASEGVTPSTIEAMAADAVAFIQAIGSKKIDLFGFSMGGYVAQTITQQNPELVRRLILAGTGPAGGAQPGAPAGPGVAQLMEQVTARAAAENKHVKNYLFFTQTPNGQAAADAFLARLQERKVDRVPPASEPTIMAHAAALGGWRQSDPSGLAAIKQPTFIANGDHDAMVPTEKSFELLKRIPNSTLSIYPDAGHGGVFQFHELFVQQALEFLRH
jgi:pimeloyl-ACP methyl ester carboxylesterase